MTIADILKAKGIDDETVAGILEDMKKQSIFTASQENLDLRYNKAKEQLSAQAKQLTDSNALIEQLKASQTGTEGLQQQAAQMKQENEQLKQELQKTRTAAAVQVELIQQKAIDPEYLAFKLSQEGELTLDENGKINGWEEKLNSLKTRFPAQFEGEGKKKILENILPDHNKGESGAPQSLEEALKMEYENQTA